MVAIAPVVVVTGYFGVIVLAPLITEPGTHAADDSVLGLILLSPLWIAGASGLALAVALWVGSAGRRAGLAWAAIAAIAGLLLAGVTGLADIITLALRGGAGAVAGYNLYRPEFLASIVLWAAAVVVPLALLWPSRGQRSRSAGSAPPGWRYRDD